MRRAIEISARMYRGLLKLYPPSHRAPYQEAMEQLFRDLCRDAVIRRGPAGLIAAWGFILGDLVGSLIVEHRAEGRNAMDRIGRALFARINPGKFVRDVTQSLLWIGASFVLVAAVLKLTSLPLTEGQLVIGILCTVAVSLQLTILGVLVTPARSEPSQGRLEG